MEVSMQLQDLNGLKGQKDLLKAKYSVPKMEPSSNSKGVSVEDSVDLSSSMSLKQINERLSTEIGKKLDEMLKAHGIDLRDAAGLDWSPEATATRIFEGVSGLLGIWEWQNPQMSDAEVIDSFEEVIRSAIDLGYSQAMTALAPLNLDDSVKSIAQETISLVHEKFDGFFLALREELKAEDSEGEA
ncbi:MAG: DUF5610 domain-containing protein [Planctomycetota bacterium]